MRLRNTTDIPNEIAKQVIAFVRPPGISNFDVMLKNGKHLAGMAYYRGSAYHATASPFVTLRVPPTIGLPIKKWARKDGVIVKWNERKPSYPTQLRTYQIGQLKGRRYYIANEIEALVYLAAHELRHLWQHKTGKRRSGMAFGARGIASEIDTESFAIRKLREWRRAVQS